MKLSKNKNQWFLAWVTGTSIILSFSGITYAQNQPKPNKSVSGPLSKNDPAAKLDSSLLNVPPIPMPVEGSSPATPSTQSSVTEIGYDVATRSAKIGGPKTLNLNSASASTSVSPSNSGADANINPEPSGSGVPSSSVQLQPSSVIGTDDRTLITNTTAYPWRTMTKLYMTFPSGNRFVCSGALISAKYVLTAGHCVHDASQGGWATKIEVIPGLQGTYKPYGSAFATYMRSYTNWTNSRDSNYDFGLVTLDRRIGDSTGWLGYGYFPSINGVTGHLGGYPGDRDNGLNLYYHYGAISSSTQQRASYPIDTAGGQSGSSVYQFYNFGSGSQRYVFAVHTNGGTTSNSGTRIDSQKNNDLKAWIGSGY